MIAALGAGCLVRFSFLSDEAVVIFLRWAGMQLISCAFIATSMLQSGHERNNLSRLILETPLMQLVGYASYPLCKSNLNCYCYAHYV
jgi:hypothetical protein